MKNLLQQIEEKWKLLFLVVLTILVYTIYAGIKVDAELVKANETIEKETYQKNLVTALYEQRQEQLGDVKNIDEMIVNLEKKRKEKLNDIERTEHIIRCEKENNWKEANETDDCKINWRNYPKKVSSKEF